LAASVPAHVEIGDSVIYQKLNDESVILNLTTQDYYGLDDVGTSMWNLLVEKGDLESVVMQLTLLYDIDQLTLRGDLHSFVEQLIGSNLLKVAAE
jgi:uncharacterized protein YkvS